MRHQGWAGKRHIKIYIYFYKFLFSAHPLMTKEWVIQSIFDRQKKYDIDSLTSEFCFLTHESVKSQTNNRRETPYQRTPIYYSLFLFLFSFLDRLSKCIITEET